ncbi:hypothetical protein [Aliiroseovarius sp. PrR006]|uniref:hypothetical protein n=1 Tax=Aliiroseovarius sp. PrR006 TaxID=2706883 RepID=UPI0013D09788|nr:hypothetical protein [Aliiroseovarius sp. PrR006]NDW54331.1 hypothetical protein [Aliiroseovarius sp. PrR006]
MRSPLAGLMGLLLLSACVQPGAPVRQPQQTVTIAPDAQGLAVLPSNQRVDFGRSSKGVIPALTRELGRPNALPLTGCPTDITHRLRWAELELSFTPERFVGWKRGTEQRGRVCV